MFTTSRTDNEDAATTHERALPAGSGGAMTYEQLLQHGSHHLAAEGLGMQQVRNMASALRLWLRIHGFQPTKIVSEELKEAFDGAFRRFCDVIAYFSDRGR